MAVERQQIKGMSAESNQEPAGSESGGTIADLYRYWHVINKRKWLILGAIGVVTALTVGWTWRKPKIYQATATVILDPQAPKVMGGQISEVVELGSGAYWWSTDYYNTQYRIIRSRTLAEQVVRKYQLHKDARLMPQGLRSSSEEALIGFAADAVIGRIRVLPIKESRIIGIAVRDTNGQLAAELANYVTQVYIEQNLAVKIDATRGATRWVATQLDEARSELDRSETALYAFKRDNNILSVALEDRQNLISKALGDFSDALTQAKRQRIDLEARRKAVEAILIGDMIEIPSTFGPQSGALEGLSKAYLDERRKLMTLRERYGPKHPEVLYQERRVETAKADLEQQAQTVLKAMDAEIQGFKTAEVRYDAEVKRLTEEALELNKKEIDYKKLRRDAENSATVYALLLKRLNESGLQEQDHANNIRQLDRALVPGSPVEPNMKNAIVLGLTLGVLLSLGLAFFIEYLDRTVKGQEDIEQVIGLPFLGLIPSVDEIILEPRAGQARELYIMRNPTSTVAECCRVVRTNVLFASPDRPLKTLVVTSSNPVEGKTMTSVNLAVVMAQGGHRTLIIDTDMRRPRMHKILGASNEKGVSSLIVGEAEIDDAIKSTDIPNVWILPCGPIPPNPAELLQTEKFMTLVEALKARFDRLIFDSPPILAVTDAAILSRVSDGTVMVVRAGKTPRDSVMRARRHIDAVNARIAGVILNDVDLKNPHYTSYYHYYHYNYRYAEAPAAGGGGSRSDEG